MSASLSLHLQSHHIIPPRHTDGRRWNKYILERITEFMSSSWHFWSYPTNTGMKETKQVNDAKKTITREKGPPMFTPV